MSDGEIISGVLFSSPEMIVCIGTELVVKSFLKRQLILLFKNSHKSKSAKKGVI